MLTSVVVGPMTERFVLWRCLHGGPLSPETIDRWASDDRLDWQALRARNVPLLKRLMATYGTCAMLARDAGRVVGMLRFYPKAIAALPEAGLLCLQQDFPNGPSEQLLETDFPPLADLADKTLAVHCLMAGSPSQQENPYQRKGIGTRLARELIRWAKERGWRGIEASAYEDLDFIYSFTGNAGRRFWEKLGFRLVETRVEPWFERQRDLLRQMQEEALAHGLDPAHVANEYTMRLELTGLHGEAEEFTDS